MLASEAPQGVCLLTQPTAYAELLSILKRLGVYRSKALSFDRLSRLVNTDLVTERGHRVRFGSNFDSPDGWRCFVFTDQREIVIEPIKKTVVRRVGG